MDRFSLDLENLPKAKKEVISVITSSYSEKRKVAFLKSLIFLGFSNIKQSDIDIATANIGKSTNSQNPKYRIILTNTPIADFLKTIKNQTTKRSCVYAFLYAGVSSYIEYMKLLNNADTDPKRLEIVEKKLFLCGLSEHLNSNLNISIKVDRELSAPPLIEAVEGLKHTIADPQKQLINKSTVDKRTSNHPPPLSTPTENENKGDGAISPTKKKIKFTTDGV